MPWGIEDVQIYALGHIGCLGSMAGFVTKLVTEPLVREAFLPVPQCIINLYKGVGFDHQNPFS